MRKMMLAAVLATLTACCLAAKTNAQTAQDVTVEARSAPAGLIVSWRLAAPVTRIAFLDQDIIRTRWTLVTPGLRLKDGVIEGARAFDAFEMLIQPDEAEVDRVYMGLTKVGAGHVLYGPAVELKGADATLALRPAAGQAAVPADGAVQGYAYLGPSEAVVRDRGATTVVGASAPEALTTIMRDGFFAAQAFYGARLGRDLPYEPTLIVTTDSPGPVDFRGDVTDSGVISTRFHGSSWDAPPPEIAAPLAAFVWHETLHLWNSHGVKTKDGDSAPWLHEGGAEYGAWVAAVSTGAVTEEEVRRSLSERLNGCRSALGDAAYDPGRLRSGSAIYNCGVVVQWIADLEARRASNGARDVFDLWKDMLDQTRSSGGYGVADFRARLQPDSAIAVLLDGPGAERWSRVEARLAALGVELEDRPGPADLRKAALFHLNDQNCTGGGTGFYRVQEGVRLDTGDKCGPLSGDPLLKTVEGHDPVADAAAMFTAVQARCAEGSSVRIRTMDGRDLEAACAAPLATPKAYVVVKAPSPATRTN